MPTHVRRQIREAAAGVLTGLTTTGTRVSQSRMRPRADALLPALLIETNEEQVSPHSIGAQLQRDLTLTVRGIAKAAADVDDTLDAIALEVETALAGAPTLSGLASQSALQRITVDFDDSTDKPVGVIALDYQVTYFVNAGSPGTVL
jgi:hypothetical protein